MSVEHIIFYNVFLRTPLVLFWDRQQERSHQIIPFLMLTQPSTSVIGLCEVFKGYCDVLTHEVQRFGYTSICLEPAQLWQTSGLFFAYKSQVWTYIQHQFVAYDTCCSYDCLATKGFIYVQLQHQQTNRIVHFVVTHLNTPCSLMVQTSQLNTLVTYMERYKDEPCIIMGDFNMSVDMIKDVFGDTRNDNLPTTIGGAQIIDHIFVKNMHSEHTCRVSALDFLSDHYPISRNVTINSSP